MQKLLLSQLLLLEEACEEARKSGTALNDELRSAILLRCIGGQLIFFSEPVAFRRVYGLEAYSRTSGESNHHRQSVNATRVTSYQLSHEGN